MHPINPTYARTQPLLFFTEVVHIPDNSKFKSKDREN